MLNKEILLNIPAIEYTLTSLREMLQEEEFCLRIYY